MSLLCLLQSRIYIYIFKLKVEFEKKSVTCVLLRPVSLYGYTRAKWRIKGKRSDKVLYINGVDWWTVRQLADTVP